MNKKFVYYFYDFDSEMCRYIDILHKEKKCKRITATYDGIVWCVKGSV